MSPKKQKLDENEQDALVSELSESAFFQPTSGQTHKTTKPLVVKYTTHLPEEVIEALRKYAFEHKLKDYEVVKQALIQFLSPDKDEAS